MSKKYILETDVEIPFDKKDIKYIIINMQECDKNKLYLLDESVIEQKGAEKAWELAKKVSIMPDEAKKEVWGTDKYNTINFGYSYAEAAEKYEAWIRKKAVDDEIKVGDEVNDCVSTGVVVGIIGDCFRVLFSNGASHFMSNIEFKKTGRHFPEIAELLKRIGGNGE